LFTKYDWIQDATDQPLDTEGILEVKNWMTQNPFVATTEQTIREIADRMFQHEISALPVVNQEKQPIAIVKAKDLLGNLLNGHSPNQKIPLALSEELACIKETDSLTKLVRLPHKHFPVVDHQSRLIGMLTRQDIIDGLMKTIHFLQRRQDASEILNVVLESAYEGIAVVNQNGIIQEFNEAYSRFTGIDRRDAIGRHVTEVIENTQLHLTVKTGIPERGDLQMIQGQSMIVHRIPIWKENQVIGAIGMLIFEGVSEVYRIFEKIKENGTKERVVRSEEGKTHDDSNIPFSQIIGESEKISNVKRIARRAARTSATVLITGESGTGKELFARSIHRLSPFSAGPFLTVNCSAIPENLFESEMFGYEEGAFSGAKKGGKPGKVELAQNGTLFLDEVGEIPLMMQAKLLRMLQEREVERVGGVKKYKVNVRIIAATNRNLEEMVAHGEFREDLFYRLNIIRLSIPPLRERTGDIAILLSHYIKEISQRYELPVKQLTSEAVSLLVEYEWPGNIRELVNVVERMVTLVDGIEISPKDVYECLPSTKFTQPFVSQESLVELGKKKGLAKEKSDLVEALMKANGNKTKAAELLGIHRTTLYQKMKRLGFT